MSTEILQPTIFEGKQADAWFYLNDNRTTEIFYGGAAGGGKSYLGCVWHVTNRTRYPGTRGLIGRASLTALEQSTLKTFFHVCERMGYRNGIDFKYNSQKHIITWSNGSETILKDLILYPADPDFISLGSTEFTDAFIDEATEITLKAFDIINSRIRWKLEDYNLIPKVLVTCNPSPGWIKDYYIVDPTTQLPVKLRPDQKFVRALVTDNPNKAFVERYSAQLSKMHSEYDVQRLLFGDWDAEADSRNPFAHQFDPQYHVSPNAVFLRDKRLYISIDFNLNPFAVTFWHYWQDQKGHHLWGIDEAEIENGSIPAMIDLITQRYRGSLHSAILTGDAMGKQRDLGKIDNASHYIELMRGLHIGEGQVVVPANPTHENSRADVNTVLREAKIEGSRFEVIMHPTRMPNTIRDFRMVQCDAFGQIIKRDRKDLNQRADYLDCGRYVINTCFKNLLSKANKLR